MPEIVLASQSPRRQQLLQWAEVPFRVVVSNSEEQVPDGLPIHSVPEYLATEKAMMVRDSLDASLQTLPILAADTIVVLHNKILGKPKDELEAKKFLKQLSGHMHEVITGVCILHNGHIVSFAETTRVFFHPLSASQISFYVEQYKPFDKAGGYAIQEWIGVVGIQRVEGDFYNVMGLPVSRVCQALASL